MERFIPHHSELDEPEYARLSSDPAWNRLYRFLQHGIWHVTSKAGWQAIRDSGWIKPNLNSRYHKRFGDVTDRSYGYMHECVSLFDFATPTERQVMRQWGNAWDVITDYQRDQVLLQLDREPIDATLLPNSNCWNEDQGQVKGGCIPWVEVWFPGEIPTSMILSAHTVPRTAGLALLDDLRPAATNGHGKGG